MGVATRIAGKDLKLRLRDRSFFIMGIITPLALAYIFHLVFGNAFNADSLELELAVIDLDGSQVSQSLGEVLSELDAEGVISLTSFDDVASADAAVEEGEVGAYILLDEGLGEAVLGGSPFTIRVVGDVDSQTTTQVASSIASEFGSAIERAQLSQRQPRLTAHLRHGGPPGQASLMRGVAMLSSHVFPLHVLELGPPHLRPGNAQRNPVAGLRIRRAKSWDPAWLASRNH